MKSGDGGAAPRQTRSVKGPKAAKKPHASAGTASGRAERWDLRLYVAGSTARSLAAFANLKSLCEEHLAGKYHIEVIDLLENPQLAKGDQIVAVPTLVRRLPEPVKKIIGHLSDSEKVLAGLQLRARGRENK